MGANRSFRDPHFSLQLAGPVQIMKIEWGDLNHLVGDVLELVLGHLEGDQPRHLHDAVWNHLPSLICQGLSGPSRNSRGVISRNLGNVYQGEIRGELWCGFSNACMLVTAILGFTSPDIFVKMSGTTFRC